MNAFANPVKGAELVDVANPEGEAEKKRGGGDEAAVKSPMKGWPVDIGDVGTAVSW
jgi:hypothetical protein